MLEYKDEIISGSDFGCEIDLEVINFSILYHDVIMVFGSDSNEEDSAFYAVNDLKGSGLNIDQINHIAEIIRGTSSHSHPCSVEASIVFDADLAILGSESQEYDNYANLVRLEYGDYCVKFLLNGGVMDKHDLIKKITVDGEWVESFVESVVNSVEREGFLREKGVPVGLEDLREGDRIRFVYSNGDVFEQVLNFDPSGIVDDGTIEFFLLERPNDVMPMNPGSVVRNANGVLFTLGKDGLWRSGSQVFTHEDFNDTQWELVVV